MPAWCMLELDASAGVLVPLLVWLAINELVDDEDTDLDRR
jgi:hypothetical protein